MARPILPRTAFVLAAATMAALSASAGTAAATPFWLGWFGHDRPVVYRPVVTPRTTYFQPAAAIEAAPRHVRHRQHHRIHRPSR